MDTNTGQSSTPIQEIPGKERKACVSGIGVTLAQPSPRFGVAFGRPRRRWITAGPNLLNTDGIHSIVSVYVIVENAITGPLDQNPRAERGQGRDC